MKRLTLVVVAILIMLPLAGLAMLAGVKMADQVMKDIVPLEGRSSAVSPSFIREARFKAPPG